MPKLFSEFTVSDSIDPNDMVAVIRNGEFCQIAAKTVTGIAAAGLTPQYVATTGNDTSGDGSSGNPWATIAKALSLIPRTVDQNYVIHVADGTYAEGISIANRISLGEAQIQIIGNSGTPNNVVLSGSITVPGTRGRSSETSTVFVAGIVNVSIVGIKTASTATGIDVYVRLGGNLTLQNFHGATATDSGINVEDKGLLNLIDTITFDAATGTGVNVLWNSTCAIYTSGGTPTMTFKGPSSVTAYCGIRAAYNSNMLIPGPANSNVTMTLQNVFHGIELGLQSCFNMFYFPSTLNIINATTPAGSCAVQATDQSSYETRNQTNWTHLTTGFLGNSLAYGEHDSQGGLAGTLALSSVGTTSSVSTGAQWLSF